MADVVDITELGDAVLALVGEYAGEVRSQAEEDSRAAAAVALESVKGASPRKTGKYARGWAMEPDAEDPSATAYRIHNKAKPGLTHPLEKGHGGPRPAGPHPHIAPAFEAGRAELERRIHG